MPDDIEVEIVVPAGADETRALDHGLVALTAAIDQLDPELVAHGFLGGEHGCGAHWENDVFAMRPYYWGDCDCGYDKAEWEWDQANPHTAECYQTELEARKRAAGLPYWDGNEWHQMNKIRGYEKQRTVENQIYAELCAKHGKDPEFGAAVHCTCYREAAWEAWSKVNMHQPTCTPELPNFLHKRTGLEVRWYKYIGRGMETKNAEGVDLQAVFAECLASLPSRTEEGG